MRDSIMIESLPHRITTWITPVLVTTEAENLSPKTTTWNIPVLVTVVKKIVLEVKVIQMIVTMMAGNLLIGMVSH